MREELTDKQGLKGVKRIVGVRGNTVVTIDLSSNTLENWLRDDLIAYAKQSPGGARALQRQLTTFDALGYVAIQHRIICTSCHIDWETRKPTFISLTLSDGSEVSLDIAMLQLDTFNTLEREYLKRLDLFSQNGLSGVYLPDVGGAFYPDELSVDMHVYRDIHMLNGAKYSIPLLEVLDNSFIPVVQHGEEFFLCSVVYGNADEKQCFPVFETSRGAIWADWYTKGSTRLYGDLITSSGLATALGKSKYSLEDKWVYNKYTYGLYAKCFNQLEYMLLTGLVDCSKVTMFSGSVDISRLKYMAKEM